VKKFTRLFIITTLMVVLFSFAPGRSALAQTDATGIEMQVEAAFDGVAKNGEWLPLWATLENNGSDVEGELRVRVTSGSGATTYAVPVPLPTGARKKVPLYVLPNSFSRELEVQLFAEGQLLKSQTVPVQPQMNISFLVGILSPERGAMSLISGLELPGQYRPIVLVDMTPDDLPDRAEGLRSFDVILLNDVDTSQLSVDQQSALLSWVQSGKRLVIGGGAGAQKTLAGLPGELVPLVADRLEELENLPDLAEFAGGDPIRVPGPFLVASGAVNDGTTLVAEQDIPIVHQMDVGSGVVDYVALDLTASPFDAWSGTTNFWYTLISPGSAYPNWLPADVPERQMTADQMNYALSSLPALDLPSVRSLTVLLFVYVLLVGPVNYLVLRWRKKQHWAWVTIPVLTLLFTAGTFALGFSLRGSDLILNKIAIVELQPDGPGRATTYYGLFSPTQNAYEVQVAGSALLSSLATYYDPWSGMPSTTSEITFLQSDPAVVRGLAVNQWSMQTFQSESVWEGFGAITADLQMGENGLIGTVRNETNATLQDAALVMGSRYVKIGDVAPGEQKEVTLSMPEEAGFRYSTEVGWLLFEDQYNTSMGASRELDVKRTMVNSVFQTGGGSAKPMPLASGAGSMNQQPVLLGWVDQVRSDVQVNERAVQEQITALVYQPLSYDLANDDGEIWLPVGSIPGGVEQYPVEGGSCGPDNTSLWLGRGEAIFVYQLPELAERVQPDQLRLSIRSDGGWNQLPTIAIYEWAGERWITLDGVAAGVNLVGAADRYINDQGKIQVKLTSEFNQGGGCLFVEMGLQGKRQ
jgi:hypothetical protein